MISRAVNMPRTLPWLAGAATKKKESKRTISSSPPAPNRERDSSPTDLVDSDLNALRPASPKRKPKERTPSTSPPPAPPDVEYMREGYHADDIYRMVEDEFYSTAQTFTQHIHRAEYVRLKKLARSRGAGTLRSIGRPTDGRTEQSGEMKLRVEAEEGAAKRRKVGLMGSDDEEEEEEDDFMNDPQLAGLMTGEERVGKDLSGMLKARANTRAAAGFDQSPRNFERRKDVFLEEKSSGVKPETASGKTRKVFEEEAYSSEEDDDLDAAPGKPSGPSQAKAEKRAEVNATVRSNDGSANSGLFKKFAKPAQDRPEHTNASATRDQDGVATNAKSNKRPVTSSEPPESNAHSTSSNGTAYNYLAKRRAEKERKEQEEKRKAKKKVDDIPTFLF